LIGLAEHLHDAQVHLKRSLLFVVTTGEEKGLLGSRYFVEHPTVPKDRLVADINLDLLRPLFPLDVLTVLGLDDSTLGDTAARVAASLHIGVQRDPEPERHLVRRSDQWSFMRAGVPAVAFVFGFRQGSPEERVYRRWYTERYHAPGDDLRQPWDVGAAATFNEFFYRLTEAVAGNDDRPRWRDGVSFSQ
jgi:Zn-dependent M28 family amino/carboxypeptidase